MTETFRPVAPSQIIEEACSIAPSTFPPEAVEQAA